MGSRGGIGDGVGPQLMRGERVCERRGGFIVGVGQDRHQQEGEQLGVAVQHHGAGRIHHVHCLHVTVLVGKEAQPNHRREGRRRQSAGSVLQGSLTVLISFKKFQTVALVGCHTSLVAANV